LEVSEDREGSDPVVVKTWLLIGKKALAVIIERIKGDLQKSCRGCRGIMNWERRKGTPIFFIGRT